MTRSPRSAFSFRICAGLAALALLLAPLHHAASEPVRDAALSRIPEALPGAAPLALPLRRRLALVLDERGNDYVPRTRHRRPDGSPLYSNRLLLEASPYLQQHAHNPVNWYPWGDEAFAAAERLGRPVLVSIGYSTCHWCHVMEEESFEDLEIARYLNQHFIAIKVDREVRPDLDEIYMASIHEMRGRGGWPLNVWVTPKRMPFYAGTYFPPRDRPGRMGFDRVLRALHDEYAKQPERLSEQAERLAAAVRERLEGNVATSTRIPDATPIERALASYSSRADRSWGGLVGPRKFPATLPIRLLLRYHRRSGDPDALELATLTLEKMAAGGMYDQLGGGFHRYATEARWLVPHFEKMLYDNALLALTYLEAWQLTGRADFERIVRETLDYLLREMRSPEGAFYSATDADSASPEGEREEGRFFTWTPAEVDAALGPGLSPVARAYYGVTPEGQLDGRSILHSWREPDAVAAELEMSLPDFRQALERARRQLYEVRSRRPPPLRDDKILVAWNGLAISALAQAGFALERSDYVADAARAAAFLLERLRVDGRLVRVYRGGRADGPAFLEDYAFLIAGLLDLYQADPSPRWIREAIALQKALDASYADEAGGGFFKTASDHEKLPARQKPSRDGAVPSGNSVAAMNLLRLYTFTTEAHYLERASMVFSAFYPLLMEQPTNLSEMLLALDYHLDETKEVVIVGPSSGGDHELAAMLRPLRSSYVPNRVSVAVTEGPNLEAHRGFLPWLSNKRAQRGRVTAYVCINRVCDLPTADPSVFKEQILRIKPLD